MILRIQLLALRNLSRNKRRTLVTGLTIVFGTLAIVLLQSLVNGLVRNSVESSVDAKYGAIQVFRRGYIGSDDPLTRSFRDDDHLRARIRAIPGVTAVAPRLDFDGMASNGDEATMFVATAIDPLRRVPGVLQTRRVGRRASRSFPAKRGRRECSYR
ncbi:MAG: ABC transporter permease [Polyangiaceae bacterium]